MRSLIDFFNHGVLPFTGRSNEVEQIIRFWRGTAESSGLRAALVTGEAGAGKSRLIEEVTPHIIAAGGLIISTKLYPGATTSLAPLIAQALWFSSTGRQLLRKEPEETMPAITMALSRLSRLRPVLLVIEDIHLLGGEAIGEFASLLEGLADETISLLCAARPVELKARGVLERYLIEEIELLPLPPETLWQLWKGLFNTTPGEDVIHALQQATLGNPLALRSALRGVVKSEALEHDVVNESWRLTISGNALAQILQQNIRHLSEGMAAYLADDERKAAGQLACLGEVFARESARALLDNSDRMLDLLTFRGIIKQTGTAAPLPGQTSRYPLFAFTHTLLHHYLADRATVDVGALIRTIGDNLPLYSVLPFRIIPEHVGKPQATIDEMCRAIDRAIAVAYALDITPDWDLAQQVLRAAEILGDHCKDQHDAEQQRHLEIRLTDCRLALMRREEQSEDFLTQLERLLELTEPPLTASLQHHRISALRHLFRSLRKRDVERCRQIWNEVDELIDANPALCYHCAYIQFLHTAALATINESDREMIPRAEKSLNNVLDSAQISEELRVYAMREVMPLFLGQFSNQQELDQRRALLAEIEKYVDDNDMIFRTRKLALLEGLGNVFEALEVIDDTLPRLRARGLLKHSTQVALIRLSATGLIGTSQEVLEEQAHRIIADAPESIRSQAQTRVATRLAQIALLRGEHSWARHIVDTFLGNDRKLLATEQIMLAAVENRLPETMARLLEADIIVEPIASFARLLVDPTARYQEEDKAAFLAELREPMLSRGSTQSVHIAAALVEALLRTNDERIAREEFVPALHDAFLLALQWLADRSLVNAMPPFIEQYPWVLSDEERQEWKRRIAELEQQMTSTTHAEIPENRHLRISMLGEIEVQLPDGTINQMRGARLRTLLGLLVLGKMVEKPFSYREFCRLAASGEDNPDKARKVMNMGVLRLREAIGTDAILTDTESPRLNPDTVHVDLLEAHRLLQEAVEGTREGALMRGVSAMVEALNITAGQVPFPGLYDDVFEAAREDFEVRLRSAIIEVSASVLREGDAISAEAILRRGFEAMPDDEEIAELLRKTLVQLGKRVEAERVRMRAEDEL